MSKKRKKPSMIIHMTSHSCLFKLGALDRCFSDEEQRDWIHKEVCCALSSACNIIPVFDNFVMPDPELLPETMRAVTSYNGVKWIHDYQDACVDKVSCHRL